MDFNVFFAEWLVRERLREVERLARAAQSRKPSVPQNRPFRVVLGLAMIRAGRGVLGQAPDAPALGR